MAGTDCTLCRSTTRAAAPPAQHRAPGDLERVVRAALAGEAVALAWGKVTSEYIGAPVFQYLSPVVLGVLCGIAVTWAARADARSSLGTQVRLLGVLLAVLGAAYGVLDEGTHDPLSTSSQVLVPYLLAAAAAWLWTAPPRRRRPTPTGG